MGTRKQINDVLRYLNAFEGSVSAAEYKSVGFAQMTTLYSKRFRSLAMRKGVEELPCWIVYVETPDSPWFIGQLLHYFVTSAFCALIDRVYLESQNISDEDECGVTVAISGCRDQHWMALLLRHHPEEWFLWQGTNCWLFRKQGNAAHSQCLLCPDCVKNLCCH